MGKNCFVICPLGGEESPIRKHADLTFDCIISPVVSAMGYEPSRADKKMVAGKLTNQIFEDLVESDLVIADLSFANPNVYYELAVRHTVTKPCIHMLSPLNAPIPFDIKGMRTILFDTDIRSGDKARDELKGQIESIEAGRFIADNPIVESRVHAAIERGLENMGDLSFNGDPSKAISESILAILKSIDDLREDVRNIRKNDEVKTGKTTSLSDLTPLERDRLQNYCETDILGDMSELQKVAIENNKNLKTLSTYMEYIQSQENQKKKKGK